MRVSELSRSSGVPVATIKYYLRAGLLHRGETTSPNQARYDDSHLSRLRLVRALVEVGGLSIAVVKDVLAAVDDPGTGVHEMLGRTLHAVTGPAVDGGPGPDGDAERADADLATITEYTGWALSESAPALAGARSVLARMHALGHGPDAGTLRLWADAANRAAEADLQAVARAGSREEVAETALVGTVLGDALLAALRRIAQEDRSRRQFRSDG